jgi:mono/diheme cytochrome c family protein
MSGAVVFRLVAVSAVFMLAFSAIAAGTEWLALDAFVPSRPAARFDSKALYGKHCQKCHGADGAGTEGRMTFADIPDFTSKTWQMKKTDAQLEVSILEGKGVGMPPFSEKLGEEQVKTLRKVVRAFGD